MLRKGTLLILLLLIVTATFAINVTKTISTCTSAGKAAFIVKPPILDTPLSHHDEPMEFISVCDNDGLPSSAVSIERQTWFLLLVFFRESNPSLSNKKTTPPVSGGLLFKRFFSATITPHAP
jgi:hypothetical protein